jgi:hypothetical protein
MQVNIHNSNIIYIFKNNKNDFIIAVMQLLNLIKMDTIMYDIRVNINKP